MPEFHNDPVVSRTDTHNDMYDGAILGESSLMNGVRGVTSAAGHGGVAGISENGSPQSGPGVYGESDAAGVWGHSHTWHGVYGETTSSTGGAAVAGEHKSSGTGVLGKSSGGVGTGVYGESDATGVWGHSRTWHGVYGETTSSTGGAAVAGEHKSNGTGVLGKSSGGVGVWTSSDSSEAIHAETRSHTMAAVAGYNLDPNANGAAIYGQKAGTSGNAGYFDGDVFVTGVLRVKRDVMIENADCAEDFDAIECLDIEPGYVMVIVDETGIAPCNAAYDRRVAGVVSGAGTYRPGIVLDRSKSRLSRQPVSLLGKVFCRVDATYDPISVGDLLTTSPTTGHAMRASDPTRAFGSVIGKALRPLRRGRELVPILIALQ